MKSLAFSAEKMRDLALLGTVHFCTNKTGCKNPYILTGKRYSYADEGQRVNAFQDYGR